MLGYTRPIAEASMHTLLHLANWSIGEGPPCEESRPLDRRFSQFEIFNLVRALRYDSYALSTLRRFLWRDGETVHRLSEDQVLERICRMFHTSRLHVCGRRPERVVVDSDVKQETEEKPPERKPPEVKEKTWVEIELVDEQGEPVAGEKYRILLPDGSVREGRLDGRGRARFDGLDPGTCEVGFPDRDGREWRAA
jgi:hypothetical protein